jgi:serine/threonine protein kinase
VYKVEQSDLRRISAMKILQDPGNDRSLSRFRREARILSQLDHPNIPHVHSFGIIEGKPYLVMDYVEGRTLAEIIETAPLSWQQVVEIGIQVCRGMAAAHAQGIVHRDINARNVMLVEEPDADHVKILDFGLSGFFDGNATPSQIHTVRNRELTRQGDLIGTIYYMSPEVCLGQKAEARSDIYSVGCLLYECLSGKKPLDADTPTAVIQRHVFEMPARLDGRADGMPKELELVVFKSLQKDPKDRFYSMDEFADALALIRDGRADQLNLAKVQFSSPMAEPSAKSTFMSGKNLRLCAVATGIVAVILLGCTAILLRKAASSTENQAARQQQQQDFVRVKEAAATGSSDDFFHLEAALRQKRELSPERASELADVLYRRAAASHGSDRAKFVQPYIQERIYCANAVHDRPELTLAIIHRMVSDLDALGEDGEARDALNEEIMRAHLTGQDYYGCGLLLEEVRYLDKLGETFMAGERADGAWRLAKGVFEHWLNGDQTDVPGSNRERGTAPSSMLDMMDRARDTLVAHLTQEKKYDQAAAVYQEWLDCVGKVQPADAQKIARIRQLREQALNLARNKTSDR